MTYTIQSLTRKEELKTQSEVYAKVKTALLTEIWKEKVQLLDDKGRIIQTSYPMA